MGKAGSCVTPCSKVHCHCQWLLDCCWQKCYCWWCLQPPKAQKESRSELVLGARGRRLHRLYASWLRLRAARQETNSIHRLSCLDKVRLGLPYLLRPGLRVFLGTLSHHLTDCALSAWCSCAAPGAHAASLVKSKHLAKVSVFRQVVAAQTDMEGPFWLLTAAAVLREGAKSQQDQELLKTLTSCSIG